MRNIQCKEHGAKKKKELEETTYYNCLKWSKSSKSSKNTTLTYVPGSPSHSIIFFEPSPSNPMLPHRVLAPLTNEAHPTEKHSPTDCKILK